MKQAGLTYDQIHFRLHVPKSTVWTWLSDTYAPSNKIKQKEHLAKIRPLAIQAKQKLQEQKNKELSRSVAMWLTHAPLQKIETKKLILASLYWAEGAKYKGVSGLKFVNTDPALMSLFITLLRQCYSIQENKFRVTLHVHGYHSLPEATKFWATLLEISPKQFNKPYIKARNPHRIFRQTIAGICLLSYLDSDVRKDIMETARQMAKRLSSPSFNG